MGSESNEWYFVLIKDHQPILKLYLVGGGGGLSDDDDAPTRRRHHLATIGRINSDPISKVLFTLIAATLCGSRPDLVSHHRSLVSWCGVTLSPLSQSLLSRHKWAQYNRDYPHDSTMVQCVGDRESDTPPRPADDR